MIPDTTDFEEIIDKLISGEIVTDLSEARRKVWIKFCYHFTDIENAKSILETGKLYSRTTALELSSMQHDNASGEVIINTDDISKKYVRFYFRPRTPTQYHNEGFRSERTLTSLNAHCPFPVFLLFDIKKILSKEGTKFTARSLAKHEKHVLYETPTEFSHLPFSKIYHESSLYGLNQADKAEIIACRHAEIVVPHELDIEEYLSLIIVRSPAEKETLINLLSGDALEKYRSLVKIDSKKYVFFGQWTYIQDVSLTKEDVTIYLNVGNTKTTFQFYLQIINPYTGELQAFYRNDNWETVGKFVISLNKPTSDYGIKIYLNNHLAYSSVFSEDSLSDLPF